MLDEGVGDPEAVELSPRVAFPEYVGEPDSVPISVEELLLSVTLVEGRGEPEGVVLDPAVRLPVGFGRPDTVSVPEVAVRDSVELEDSVGWPDAVEFSVADGRIEPLIEPLSEVRVADSVDLGTAVELPFT